MIRCSQCKESVIGYTKLNNWLMLNSFIRCLTLEGTISEHTADCMYNALQDFKHYAYESVEETQP